MARQWTINGRFLSQPTTGVQRYAREVVRQLDHLISEGHPLTRDLDVAVACPPGSEWLPLTSVQQFEVGRYIGHAWEQVDLPASLDSGSLLSLCNTGPLRAPRQILCIHDANIWNAPSSYSFQFRLLYKSLLPMLGKRSWRVATVSEFSKAELVRCGITSAAKIFTAPNGHEHALRWQPHHSEASRRAASRDTIVVVGSPAPHKNIDMLLGMADRLADAGLQLAVVGVADQHVFRHRVQSDAPNVRWLGRINDSEMAALLQDSLCLAFPSLTEGFGLPALEAMALGCPVVVSNRASLPEVCGCAANYASPDDPAAWLASFLTLRQSSHYRIEMIAKGRARASAYRWRATAIKYLEALADADGVRSNAMASTLVGHPG